MNPVKGVSFIHGDMNKSDIHDKILEKNNFEKFDLICSDMCPEFSGVKFKDHVSLINLNEITVNFSFKVLKKNGNLVLKTFEGTLQKKFQEGFKNHFNKIHRFKPSSSRSESSELYLVCIGYLINEELKKEAEKIAKMDSKEYFETSKEQALKAYRLAKLNSFTLLEDLDKMKKEIEQKFKVDPEKIRVDPKEEEELKKIIEDENEKLRLELYGRAYKPLKSKSIVDFVKDYEKEMKEYNDKLKVALEKEKIDPIEIEEFFNEDVNQKHMQDVANDAIKEAEYMNKKINALKERISEEDAKEVLRPNSEPNEILAKYKRWEKILQDIEKTEKENISTAPEDSSGNLQDELTSKEDQYLNNVENLRKKLRKNIKKKENNVPGEDIFWSKRHKNDKNDKNEK
jgi:hypothetical protein